MLVRKGLAASPLTTRTNSAITLARQSALVATGELTFRGLFQSQVALTTLLALMPLLDCWLRVLPPRPLLVAPHAATPSRSALVPFYLHIHHE
jgi:hypothetical protein